ncbi:MAG: sigma-E processing peptidase SpoIIGA, partial [Clostridia bacterium]|nr:sigma-E processing peptidase SpoIIGA [Clostridia bacterium]
HYINFGTLQNKNGKMLVFTIEEIEILNNKKNISKKNQAVGLSLVNFKKNFNCDALISAEML